MLAFVYSQQANQQTESLQQQLHMLAGQRDQAYLQVASLQDQCEQYARSLNNLQLVLEQFQQGGQSQVIPGHLGNNENPQCMSL